ncbi:hypothetical protein EJ04DRAFT_58195 [Polyplosphaeria fusca]|uniref:Uncharacterized protein n=1 Tax=Polyplosphaeria fusca TaxID=682080 RepID=A0A9P4QS37_9PLEO|nr:hypothetical protein EJ04DRAFT_58195 [Polyplosphaeria fusca]
MQRAYADGARTASNIARAPTDLQCTGMSPWGRLESAATCWGFEGSSMASWSRSRIFGFRKAGGVFLWCFSSWGGRTSQATATLGRLPFACHSPARIFFSIHGQDACNQIARVRSRWRKCAIQRPLPSYRFRSNSHGQFTQSHCIPNEDGGDGTTRAAFSPFTPDLQDNQAPNAFDTTGALFSCWARSRTRAMRSSTHTAGNTAFVWWLCTITTRTSTREIGEGTRTSETALGNRSACAYPLRWGCGLITDGTRRKQCSGGVRMGPKTVLTRSKEIRYCRRENMHVAFFLLRVGEK